MPPSRGAARPAVLPSCGAGDPRNFDLVADATDAQYLLGRLLLRAWRTPTPDRLQLTLLWATAVLATPVVNLYVGVYDSVLAVLGALLTWSWTGAALGFLWGGLVRVFVMNHVIYWCIN